jgi:vesicle transport protein SEC22
VITKKRKEYRDSNTKENIDRLNQELLDVSKIMSENFEMILNRGGSLNKLTELSSSLKEDSKKVRRL